MICEYLEKDRCNKLGLEANKEDKEDLTRRDWEGKDNMRKYDWNRKSYVKESREGMLPIRETRNMKADRRS